MKVMKVIPKKKISATPILTKSVGRTSFADYFNYRPPTLDTVKRIADRKGGRYDTPFKDEFDVYRPRDGDNMLRILPPTWDGHKYFGYQVWMHSWVGMNTSNYICPLKMKSKKCPICVAAQESHEAGEVEEAKRMQAAEKYVFWVLDRLEKQQLPQLWVISWTLNRDLANVVRDKKSGKLLIIDNPDVGYDISFTRTGAGLNTRYGGLAVDREPSPVAGSEKEARRISEFVNANPVPTTLKFQTTEHLRQMMSGAAEQADPDQEDKVPEVDEDDEDQVTEEDTDTEDEDQELVTDEVDEDEDEEALEEAEAEDAEEATAEDEDEDADSGDADEDDEDDEDEDDEDDAPPPRVSVKANNSDKNVKKIKRPQLRMVPKPPVVGRRPLRR